MRHQDLIGITLARLARAVRLEVAVRLDHLAATTRAARATRLRAVRSRRLEGVTLACFALALAGWRLVTNHHLSLGASNDIRTMAVAVPTWFARHILTRFADIVASCERGTFSVNMQCSLTLNVLSGQVNPLVRIHGEAAGRV